MVLATRDVDTQAARQYVLLCSSAERLPPTWLSAGACSVHQHGCAQLQPLRRDVEEARAAAGAAQPRLAALRACHPAAMWAGAGRGQGCMAAYGDAAIASLVRSDINIRLSISALYKF